MSVRVLEWQWQRERTRKRKRLLMSRRMQDGVDRIGQDGTRGRGDF